MIQLRGNGPDKPMHRVLLHEDGTPVEIGDAVRSDIHDRARYIITGWHHGGRNRVYVQQYSVDAATGCVSLGYTSEYFPHVFNMQWEDQL